MTMGDSADEILLQIKEKAVKPSSRIYWHFRHAFSCRTNSLPMEQSVRLQNAMQCSRKATESYEVQDVFCVCKGAFQSQSPPFAEQIVCGYTFQKWSYIHRIHMAPFTLTRLTEDCLFGLPILPLKCPHSG